MIYGSTLTMGIDYLMIVCCSSENEGWPPYPLSFSRNPFKTRSISLKTLELGKIDPKNLRSGPINMPEVQVEK